MDFAAKPDLCLPAREISASFALVHSVDTPVLQAMPPIFLSGAGALDGAALSNAIANSPGFMNLRGEASSRITAGLYCRSQSTTVPILTQARFNILWNGRSRDLFNHDSCSSSRRVGPLRGSFPLALSDAHLQASSCAYMAAEKGRRRTSFTGV
jgi:hypothetical protein